MPRWFRGWGKMNHFFGRGFVGHHRFGDLWIESPKGPQWYGWHFPFSESRLGGWWLGGMEVPSEDDLDKVRSILRESSLGQPYYNRWGLYRRPILHGNSLIGWLFEDIDLGSVDVRGVWKSSNIVRAHLVSDKKIVGWVLVSV